MATLHHVPSIDQQPGPTFHHVLPIVQQPGPTFHHVLSHEQQPGPTFHHVPSDLLILILKNLLCWQTVQFARLCKSIRVKLQPTPFFQEMKRKHDDLYNNLSNGQPIRLACQDDYYDKVIEYGTKHGGAIVFIVSVEGYWRGFIELISRVEMSEFEWSIIYHGACKHGRLPAVIAAIILGKQDPSRGIRVALKNGQHLIVDFLVLAKTGV